MHLAQKHAFKAKPAPNQLCWGENENRDFEPENGRLKKAVLQSGDPRGVEEERGLSSDPPEKEASTGEGRQAAEIGDSSKQEERNDRSAVEESEIVPDFLLTSEPRLSKVPPTQGQSSVSETVHDEGGEANLPIKLPQCQCRIFQAWKGHYLQKLHNLFLRKEQFRGPMFETFVHSEGPRVRVCSEKSVPMRRSEEVCGWFGLLYWLLNPNFPLMQKAAQIEDLRREFSSEPNQRVKQKAQNTEPYLGNVLGL